MRTNIKFIDVKSFRKIISKNKHHLEKILEIVKSENEELEGNYFYYDKTFKKIKNHNKRINLFSLSKNCENILEIGFGAGHSTLLFLLSNPKSIIQCFDICENKYTEKCFEYLSSQFPNRIFLHKGNSNIEIENFKKNTNILFDLIHIDGSHDLPIANIDFFKTKDLAKKDGILIFDDTYILGLKILWEGFVKDKHIEEIEILPVDVYEHRVGYYLHN